MTELLSYKDNFSKTLKIAYPVMLSQIGHILVGIIDSLMVGQLGPEPLAASSFANSVFSVFLMFGIGLSFGITPLVAQADGKKDEGTITRVLRQGIILCIVAGFVLFLGLGLVYYALPYLGQTKEVVSLGEPYYLIIASSIIPLMIFQNFKQFAEGLSVTKQIMFITIAANLINVLFNYLLIFGNMGFPELGLNGAGWATLISRIFMMIAGCWFVLKGRPFSRFRDGFNLLKAKAGYFKPMLQIGVPAGTQFLFEVGAFSMAAVMMGWIGDKELAAHQIAIGLVALSYMAATGISAASTVRIGNLIGQSDGVNLFRTGNANFALSLFVMSACAVIFVLVHDVVPGFYINDPEVIRIAASLIIIAGFFQLSDGVQVVGLGNLRGMSDVKVPTVITLVAYWGLAMPVSYIFGFVLDFGPEGIWYGLLTGLTTAAVLLYFRFKRLSKKRALAFQIVPVESNPSA
ncbi:MAG: MATE family efflux transporter [Roseivirga sp.]